MTTQMGLQMRSAVCLFAFFLLANVLAAAQFAGGTGEPNDPYRIATAEQLCSIGSDPNLLDRHFVLTADIDLDPNLPGGKVFDRAVVAPDGDPITEGYQGAAFSGVFDGSDYTISNLRIRGACYLGLFGQNSGVVRNVGVEDADIAGSGYGVGAVAGANLGAMVKCHSTGQVAGKDHGFVGGVIGLNDTGRVILCYSRAATTGTGNAVGGLIGQNRDGYVTRCYSTGVVSGAGYVGGLIGVNRNGCVIHCYSTGTVFGSGGLVGSSIDRGWSSSVVVGCFWDTETSRQVASAGGTGKTTARMQDRLTFLAAGWDFVGETANGVSDAWQMAAGEYPQLRCYASDDLVMPEGLGTAEQPYLIRDADDLGAVWLKPAAHYRLEASVDLSGITWTMAVVPWFDGTFDGNGHAISNLRIKGVSYVGLFGESSPDAVLSNLRLETVNINGTASYVGGLVGCHGGRIYMSSCSGSLMADSYVGGLVGVNRGVIETSNASSGVNGIGSYTGGLVGCNFGSIAESHSDGAVNGDAYVGGLAGCNDEGDIAGSDNAAVTSGIGSYVGGIAGYNSGSIAGSHNLGPILGPDHVGGLAGWNSKSVASSYNNGTVNGDELVGGLAGYNTSDIATSYSAGTVTGDISVGGLIGRNDGRVTASASHAVVRGKNKVGGFIGYNISTLGGIKVLGSIVTCYSAGAVSGSESVGGFVGHDNSTGNLGDVIVGCFWDTETSGQTTSSVGTGRTTAQMQTAATFLDAGWDFASTWFICEGKDYPRLQWEAVDCNQM
ncbi:MAG: hypothetical protein KBE65_14535 [Phycisphaerae bacterium]|nr:hypothetical protein [Phycisphaerae bacterium]